MPIFDSKYNNYKTLAHLTGNPEIFTTNHPSYIGSSKENIARQWVWDIDKITVMDILICQTCLPAQLLKLTASYGRS